MNKPDYYSTFDHTYNTINAHLVKSVDSVLWILHLAFACMKVNMNMCYLLSRGSVSTMLSLSLGSVGYCTINFMRRLSLLLRKYLSSSAMGPCGENSRSK